MRPIRIDLFEDYLYIAMQQNNTLVRLHKFGSLKMNVLEAGLTRISDLVVCQENKQYVPDVLELNKTSNIKNALCLTSHGGQTRSCVCGDGFVELKSTNGSEVIREWSSVVGIILFVSFTSNVELTF